jgi:hypothetical protein
MLAPAAFEILKNHRSKTAERLVLMSRGGRQKGAPSSQPTVVL